MPRCGLTIKLENAAESLKKIELMGVELKKEGKKGPPTFYLEFLRKDGDFWICSI